MNSVLLSDEETNYQIDYVLKHNDLPLECLLLPLVQSSNKAQLKKVVEWGNEECKEHSQIVQAGKYPVAKIVKQGNCPECWQALLKEIE